MFKNLFSRTYEVFYDSNNGVTYHKTFARRWPAGRFFRQCQRLAPQGCGEFARLSADGDSTILRSYEGGDLVSA